MPAHIINEGIVSGGMFIAIGESIIARVAALGGYISFSVTDCPKTPYEHVHVNLRIQITESQCPSACNVKIQALNIENFRLRFTANFKIQI